MSRRPSSSMPRTPSSASAPYSRRTPGQPKSTRQQFSACGACRMRRVRCDLKEFCSTTTVNGLQQPACSNCRERNIRCVDEFAEVKAVKLLRRGRRLQQVEARYGKVIDDDSALSSVEQEPTSPTFSAVTSPSCIPQMQPPFLTSSFFRRFCVQYPIIEPGEFASRYIAHTKGTAPLDVEGKMLAMLLVTWAASFGIDEFGNEDTEDGASESIGNSHFVLDGGDKITNSKRQARLLRTETMIREILTLVDLNGLLRRPSWDGVKVLLLLLPLTHGIQGPIEHLTTHEAILSQVRALCNLNNSPSVNSGLGPYCDILIRARIFWSAHVHEGITTGLNGGRLVLDDDDLASFQSTLPPQYCASAAHSVTSSADSSCSSPRASPPLSPTFPFVTPLEPNHPRAALAYLVTTQYFSLALAVSKACRAIHSTLTGPRARRQTDAIRGESVTAIWDALERCWDNFETLRRNASGVGAAGGDLIRGEDVERFVSGWQIFIFGCLNTIREALRNLTRDNHSNHAVAAALYLSAIGRCHKFLPRVIQMLQRHLKVPSSFFAYDTGLIRDGCFFAGLLLAQSDKLGAELGAIGCNIDWEEGVAACLQALGEARWACYRSQAQEKTLKAEWEARLERDGRRQGQQSPRPFPIKQSPGHSPCLNDNIPLPCTAPSTSNPQTLSLVAAGGQVRPYLPPLSVSFPHDDSGPDTVLTDDGSGGWEPYTPPSTSGSLTGTVVTHRSLSPSPHQSIMGPMHGVMKHKGSMFGDDSDTDHFSFAVERTPDSQSSVGSGTQARWTPFGGDYLDPRIILAASDVVGCDDGFPPFGSNRQSFFV
ncbi:hypothetical protein JVT61DRAFT_11540 [Boletus reticuloceps]|uniref:Zn(2)-C6 fungal-type domain-containing protein n=1 Tax=Boletus reticuloceps TaxID=495285 RepID=A0A8I2YTN9_9AGAM|nr:hypothetical protein JVT61DRAFT_11540 [Boletus reticuloceps]